MYECATTFEEHIQIVSTEIPHGAVLDWWRKVSLVLDDYFMELGERRGKASEVECRIASDPKLRLDVATRLRDLRQRRNDVAHKDVGTLSPDEAIRYATEALHLIWDLAFPGWRSRR